MSGRTGPVIFSEIAPFLGLSRALAMPRKSVIEEIRSSNLKGRGGAGFPTGVKWNLAAAAQAEEKYVVCNADEGEPGTFKDRILLTEYLPLVLEGMMIAGYALGARKGYIYLRREYRCFREGIEEAVAGIRRDGFPGKEAAGGAPFEFDIEVRLGAGAYVCGEETALIESMEGQRGEPRNRPPFPVNTGYLGCPTVVNNVETLAAVPHILAKGAGWFRGIGTEQSSGSKLLSVSGDCRKPGVYEVPFGTTVNDVLGMVDGGEAKAVQVGGASGSCIGREGFSRRIAFEDLPTGGSVIVFDRSRNMLDPVVNFLEFFREESCGQCTPCREGIPVLLEGVERIRAGECTADGLRHLLSLSETMQCASKCGLGQSAPNAFLAVIESFGEDYSIKG